MATTKTLKLNPGTSLSTLIDVASQNLSMQGFDVKSQVMGPNAAEIIVSKDREGLKNSLLGLGLESRVAITSAGDTLSLAISSEWTNKIVALVIGWFLCLIPFITGLVGVINQYSLPEKIETAFTLATNSGTVNASPVDATPVDFTPIDPQDFTPIDPQE